MAGTLIQQEIIGSEELAEIARAMNWDEDIAIGKLVRLWNGSQNRKLILVSSKQIGIWCRLPEIEQRTLFIDTLCSDCVGLLKRKALDTFEIIGNRKQIYKLKELKARGKRGGDKTRSKWIHQQRREEDAEPRAGAAARPHSPPLPSPLNHTYHSPLCLSPSDEEHDKNQESFALGGSGAGNETAAIDKAIAAAMRGGRWTEVEHLRAMKSQFRVLDEKLVSA